jgi:hypothetical protein
VTYSFTRYTTRSNCAKIAALYFYTVNQIGQHIQNYFPHTCIRSSADFFLPK